MSIEEKRRAAFEKWVTRNGEAMKNVKREHGFYKLIWVQQSWTAWNAALDSICVELPKFADDYARNDGIAECQEALTAAGVPYK